MAKRTSEQTATAAINRLFPSEHPRDIRSRLKQVTYRAEDLLDAFVDGEKVVEKAVRTFPSMEMVHVSVAAVYCRRSENTFGNAVKKKGRTYSDLKTAGQATKRSGKRHGGGSDTELFYRMDLVKEMAEFLKSVGKNANRSRSKPPRNALQNRISPARNMQLGFPCCGWRTSRGECTATLNTRTRAGASEPES